MQPRCVRPLMWINTTIPRLGVVAVSVHVVSELEVGFLVPPPIAGGDLCLLRRSWIWESMVLSV